ncbi:hypothetical protein [Hansschlegelia zhihuaiae]|uniref:Uncharacterized protein n=1 Tax=Hansschlegelia zhihuaiae TaxID=405005 RepID=A0A4Q0MGH9_9HYPH|nr:hypothetical protein [Hansschlegelia zhihuaiae]RXF72099.1 hypothetical protein EK403_14920 [Hansschlegelia zhihuaiae]
MSASVDQLAGALGAARAAHEKRPDNLRLESAFHAARAAFLEATLKEREEELRIERRRMAGLRAELARLTRDFKARAAALIRKARPEPRRRGEDLGAPLFERVGE